MGLSVGIPVGLDVGVPVGDTGFPPTMNPVMLSRASTKRSESGSNERTLLETS